jgi:DNA-binding transcriptional MerR regulator/effector-binding domain-containing protein
VLSIGEFSRVTQLSVKALRLYHEKGLLVPEMVSLESKYRYYSAAAVEKARVINRLKDMSFTLDEIKTVLTHSRSDKELARAVENKLREVQKALGQYQSREDNLRLFLQSLESGRDKQVLSSDVVIEDVPETLVCSIRFKGRYDEVGPRFGTIYKACGRLARGKPFSLYFDGEFKEEAADIEACVEVKARVSAKGLDCRKLKAGRAATLIHKGAYETLGRSYQRLFEHCREQGLDVTPPIREYYLKGPGLVFRGYPRNYLTKLMAFV